MKKQLTEKTAYWISYLLWNWLAKTGYRKYGWPGWAKWGNIYGRFNFWCPLCKYHIKADDIRTDCVACNKRCKWTRYVGNPSDPRDYCESPDSLYAMWCATGVSQLALRKERASLLAIKFREIHRSL